MYNIFLVKKKLAYLILKILSEESLHGYALRKKISQMTDNFINPSFGALYPAINELIEQEFISVKEDGRKKVYSLTNKGKAYYNDVFKKIDNIANHKFLHDCDNLTIEDKMSLFLAWYQIGGNLLTENIPDMYLFLQSVSKKKLSDKQINEVKAVLGKVFETIKKINKQASEKNN